MFHILTVVLYFIVATIAAPATPAGVTSLLTPILATSPKYVLLPTTQAQYHHQSSSKFQPALKLQQPIVHQLAPFERIQAPKEQLYILYPNSPITQYPVLLKQTDGNTDWWIAVQNFFQNIGGNVSQVSESPTDPPPKPAEEAKSELEKDTEKLPTKILTANIQQPLSMEKRYYIISGQPQFYGNFEALNSPIATASLLTLDSFEAIKFRSGDNSILAEPNAIEAKATASAESGTKIFAQQSEMLLPAILASKALSSSLVKEADNVQQIKSNNLPGSTQELLNTENDPSVIAVKQQLARFLSEAKSQDINSANSENNLIKNEAILNAVRKESEQQNAGVNESSSFELDNETSIAQAKPNAIAISGRGGVSSSQPIATALVGDGGLALSSPSATAVSGEFDEDDVDPDRKKLKK